MAGAFAIPTMPKIPITANQTSMTGPNMPPIQDVPLRWTANSTTRITTVNGTTNFAVCGA